MIVHVLPGDAAAEIFERSGIEGDVLVCREAFVVGPLSVEIDAEFWERRRVYHEHTDPDAQVDYHEQVERELDRLRQLDVDDEVNLWFENELFCQVNFWFCLKLLKETGAKVYRVSPVFSDLEQRWKGFSGDLRECFARRIEMSADDQALGRELADAFATRHRDALIALGESKSPAFSFLDEVCEAAAEIETRPRAVLRQLIERGESDASAIIREFSVNAGEYGFGDSQVGRILSKLKI